MTKKKYPFFRFLPFILIFSECTGVILGQEIKVSLDEVKIIGSRKTSYVQDAYAIRMDSVLGGLYSGSDLATILKSESNVNLTEYGGHGSLASIRLRGSGPSHTQINWNGIPLNGPTTGTADLALVPAGMADAADIVYGASGSIFGSGTFGGAINLWNQPDWNNRLSIGLSGEAGSWSHLKSTLSFRTGGANWQYHADGMIQSSHNGFSFNNIFKDGFPLEYRTHNELFLMGGQHHFFLRFRNNLFLQYGSWLFDRQKSLPAPIGSEPVFLSDQKDAGNRHYIKLVKWLTKSSMELLAGRFSDSLTYSERNSKTDSLVHQSGIRSTRIYSGLTYKWFLSSTLTLENAIEADFMRVRADAYSAPVSELRGAVIGLLQYHKNNIKGAFSLRNEFNPHNPPKPLFSVQFNYMLHNTGIVIKSQVSNKFRVPSLNERYWKPGGNPDLLPESGLGTDFGFSWHVISNNQSEDELSLSLYHQNINNWIQWIPAGSYWSPANVSKVRSRGIEISWTGLNHLGNVKIKSQAMYSFSNCYDLNRKQSGNWWANQLPYVPFHSVFAGAAIQYRGFETGLTYRFSSMRYTTDDHDPWLALQGFHILDMRLGYAFNLPSGEYRIFFRADNLLNNPYQLVRGYPMPGRNFTVSLSGTFKKIRND